VRTKDSCWSVGTIYDPRELPGVSTTGPRIGRGVTVAIRSKNFSTEEDSLLCSAYLNVDKDLITRENQTLGSYWARVHKYLTEHKTSTITDRSVCSLQHRWGIIQRETRKFCALYDKVCRRCKSGQSEDEKVGYIS
jgi:hypothetical protein